MAWEEEETETLREESKVGSVCLSVLGLGSWYACGTVLFGFGYLCVRVCSISPQTFQTGVFMFELRSWIVCVWLCAVWVCVCTFHLSSSIRDRVLYV